MCVFMCHCVHVYVSLYAHVCYISVCVFICVHMSVNI